MGKLILLLGGARSGKSSYAEKLACQGDGQVAYIATAEGLDTEMVSRIKNHKKTRPSQWVTFEIPRSVGDTFRQYIAQTDLVILDCLTLLVSNLLFHPANAEHEIDEQEATRVINKEISELFALIKGNEATWIVVTNEVGLGLVPPYPLGRVYRDQLGWVNQQLAAVADEVYFMVAGIPVPIDQFRK
jgi:adenosylcobinamide kinase/adenosylcobinamide-phosphate guanylyltransferase